MKKILSLALAALLLVSMIPTAMAAENNWQGGTKVEYTATANEQYTVTVPATLAPGGSGDVVASGTWGSNRKLTVTADKDVTLTNSINAADQKVLDVTFAGIELTGSNTESVSDTKQVAVANITDAIFGTWSGTFNYNVAMSDVAGSGNTGDSGTTEPSDPDAGDGEEATTFTFSLNNVQQTAETGMTWAQWVESKYNTDGYKIITAKQTFSDTETVELIANETNYVKNITVSEAISNLTYGTSPVADNYAHPDYPMHITIDDVQYNFLKGMTYGDWVNSEYNTIGCVVANIKHRSTGSEMQAIVTADKTKYLMDGSPVELSDTISKYDTNEWIEFGSSGSWWEFVE